jgi:6-pyruvoyltetrahydropterin/6-carboxytetrahydropterin synthase
MYEVCVSGSFFASHQLRSADGTLEPRHAHIWRVAATFGGPRLDDTGLLLDFTWIKPRLDGLLASFYDTHLNDHPVFTSRNPSAENVARHLAEQLERELPNGVRLESVAVEEEPGCTATYRPGNG